MNPKSRASQSNPHTEFLGLIEEFISAASSSGDVASAASACGHGQSVAINAAARRLDDDSIVTAKKWRQQFEFITDRLERREEWVVKSTRWADRKLKKIEHQRNIKSPLGRETDQLRVDESTGNNTS